MRKRPRIWRMSRWTRRKNGHGERVRNNAYRRSFEDSEKKMLESGVCTPFRACCAANIFATCHWTREAHVCLISHLQQYLSLRSSILHLTMDDSSGTGTREPSTPLNSAWPSMRAAKRLRLFWRQISTSTRYRWFPSRPERTGFPYRLRWQGGHVARIACFLQR